MSEVFTTGSRTPKEREEDAFVAALQDFAGWPSQAPGAGVLRLARDTQSEGIVSFGRWESLDAVHACKQSPEFKERMGHLQRHVTRVVPAELAVVATVDGGSVTA